MHAYRDALSCKKAAALYPGTRNVFFSLDGSCLENIEPNGILCLDFEGVGAIAFVPKYKK
ncbi:MAG: hypothetical protein QXJ58_06035 [Archaeoglobaceae archaeon]